MANWPCGKCGTEHCKFSRPTEIAIGPMHGMSLNYLKGMCGGNTWRTTIQHVCKGLPLEYSTISFRVIGLGLGFRGKD